MHRRAQLGGQTPRPIHHAGGFLHVTRRDLPLRMGCVHLQLFRLHPRTLQLWLGSSSLSSFFITQSIGYNCKLNGCRNDFLGRFPAL